MFNSRERCNRKGILLLAALITAMLCGCGSAAQNAEDTATSDKAEAAIESNEVISFENDVNAEMEDASKETAEDTDSTDEVIVFEDVDSDLVKAYADALKLNNVRAFDLIDIDEDGNKELLASEGDYHAGGVYVYKINPEDYSVTELGLFGGWGELAYIPEQKCIISGYLSEGDITTKVSVIEGYEIKELLSFFDNEGGVGEEIQYLINGTQVDEAEYREALKPYYGDDVLYTRYSDMYPIEDDESVLAVLRDLLAD